MAGSVPVPAFTKRLAEHVVGVRGKKLMKYGLLRTRMALGAEPFTAQHGMDRRLLSYLPDRSGFFIESGANDGVDQSNTYYLEQRLGWTGILVEPIEQLADLARRFRKASVRVAALGPPEKSGDKIELTFRDLMSGVLQSGTAKWGGLLGPNPSRCLAPVQTLSSIIENGAGGREIDLLSLDVENYELEALRGLDLSRHAPRLILIETDRLPAVTDYLGPRYSLASKFSPRDYLFRRN